MASFFPRLQPLPSGLSPWSPVVIVVTWFHSGRLAPASGTWGSLAALPLALGIMSCAGPMALFLFGLACFVAGVWIVPRYTAVKGEKDPSEIVIDEVIGIAVTFLPLVRFDTLSIVLGFAAFRLFDALKPGPIGWCDRRLPGAWGVLLDDVVAGVLAAFCVYGLQRYS